MEFIFGICNHRGSGDVIQIVSDGRVDGMKESSNKS